MLKQQKKSQPTKQSRVQAKAAMNIDFKVHFTGLCAFVPYQDAQKISRMRVALIDAESPDILANTMSDAIHTPALLVADRFLDSSASTRKASFSFDGSTNDYDPKTWLFLLRQEELSITGLKPIDIKLPAGTGSDCPQDPVPSFSDWIQAMPSNCNQMTQSAFNTFTDVIARMDLFDGDLYTSRFPRSYKDNSRLLKWYLDSDQGTSVKPAKAIAEEITFSKQWQGATSVTISVGTGGQIVLKPDQQEIELWVVNLPLIDIVVNRSKWSAYERTKEHHFYHYYRLATNTVDLIPWPDPNPANFCPPPPTAGVANPRCPPALFAGVV
jgi:hypothetical protein